jgi:hypothetical protein
MPCFVGCLALLFPRVALALVAIFNFSYIENAFSHLIWPILGFIFMPLTTLAYAWAINENGSVSGVYLAVVVVAVIIDLGLLGTGESSRRKKYRVVEVRRERV